MCVYVYIYIYIVRKLALFRVAVAERAPELISGGTRDDAGHGGHHRIRGHHEPGGWLHHHLLVCVEAPTNHINRICLRILHNNNNDNQDNKSNNDNDDDDGDDSRHRILHGPRQGDSRDHASQDPYVYVVFWAPFVTRTSP